MATKAIKITISAADQYSGLLAKAKSSFISAGKTIGKSIQTGAKIAAVSIAAAGAAVAAASAALFGLVSSSAAAGDEFQKMSLRLGIGTQKLSEYKHVAEISGTSIATFETAIRTMSKRMLDAKNGLSTASRSFESLGISVTDASGNLRASDQVFEEATKKMKLLSNDTERLALSQELFGRSGSQLLPLMKSNATSIADIRKEAISLGITYDEVAAGQSAEFVDAMTRVSGSFTGIKNAIAKEFTPAFTKMANDFQERVKGMLPMAKAFASRLKTSIFNIPEIVDLSLTTASKLFTKFFTDFSFFKTFLTNAAQMGASLLIGFSDTLIELMKMVLKLSSVIWVPLGETFSILGSIIRNEWEHLNIDLELGLVKLARKSAEMLNNVLPSSQQINTTALLLSELDKAIEKGLIKPAKTFKEAFVEGGATIRGMFGDVGENVENIRKIFNLNFNGVKSDALSFVNSSEMKEFKEKLNALMTPGAPPSKPTQTGGGATAAQPAADTELLAFQKEFEARRTDIFIFGELDRDNEERAAFERRKEFLIQSQSELLSLTEEWWKDQNDTNKIGSLTGDLIIKASQQARLNVISGANKAMEDQILSLVETRKFSVAEFAKTTLQTVKIELVGLAARAAVWALFQTGMGFATAFTNPAASAAHFAAAGQFALISGASLAGAAAVQSVAGASPGGPLEQREEDRQREREAQQRELERTTPKTITEINVPVPQTTEQAPIIINLHGITSLDDFIETKVVPGINKGPKRNIFINQEAIA